MARKPGYIYALGFSGDGSLLTDLVTISNVASASSGQFAVYTDPVTIGGLPGLSFSNSTLSIQGDLTITGTISSTNTCNVIPGTYGTSTMIPQITVSSTGRIESINLNKVGPLSLEDRLAIAQTITTNGKIITNIVDAYPGTYGSSTLIPQITISNDGRISDITNACFCLNLDEIASFNNKTISYFEFNNSLGIQGNINFSGPETVSFTANTPGMNLSFDEWNTIRLGLNVQQITGNLVQLTDSDTFKWHIAESETTVALPTDSKVGTWIGFTNLSTTSNIVLANCTTILPATDQAGISRRMVCISQGRWICS